MVEQAISGGSAALLLIIAFINDVRSMRIPNMLTVTFFAAGCCFHTVFGGMDGAIDSLLGALTGFGPLLALYWLKGIGAGDVKLFAALGAWIGAPAVFQVMIAAILYAGAVGIVLLFVKGSFGQRLLYRMYALVMPSVWDKREVWSGISREGIRFPFMLAVAPGALTVWFMVGIS